MTIQDGPALAAIIFDKGQAVDGLLRAVADRMTAAGRRVLGAIQTEEMLEEGCCGPMLLSEIGGATTVISQALGSQARGCRLDPQALAAVAGRLERQLSDGCDLLVLNRFGKAEAEGHGFRGLLERALAAEIPVLLSVRSDFLSGFADFHGGLAVHLPAEPTRVFDWADQVCRNPYSVVPELESAEN